MPVNPTKKSVLPPFLTCPTYIFQCTFVHDLVFTLKIFNERILTFEQNLTQIATENSRVVLWKTGIRSPESRARENGPPQKAAENFGVWSPDILIFSWILFHNLPELRGGVSYDLSIVDVMPETVTTMHGTHPLQNPSRLAASGTCMAFYSVKHPSAYIMICICPKLSILVILVI